MMEREKKTGEGRREPEGRREGGRQRESERGERKG